MLNLPELVFGATSLGNLFREISDAEKSAIVDAWLEAPFRPVLIDTAGKYGAGLSLEVIGRELARCQADRERVLISNKLGWRRVPLEAEQPTFEPGVWFGLQHDAVQDISYDGILRCFEEGNQLLGDFPTQLVSVHDPDEYLAASKSQEQREKRWHDILGAYRALTELKDAGRVLGVGVGAKDWRVIRDLSEQCELDWAMFANSFTILQHPPGLVELIDGLSQKGVAVINSAVFHGGFLLGGDFFNYQDVSMLSNAESLLQWREQFWQACEDFSTTPFQAGVSFGVSHPGIASVALSSSRSDRVVSHIKVLDSAPPSEFWEHLCELGLLSQDYPYLP